MRHFRDHWTIEGVAAWALHQSSLGHSDGTDTASNRAYLWNCTAAHYPTGTQILLTRDEGHHACGWWKNPDYERCLHLSLSFRDRASGEFAPKDRNLTDEWLRAIFGESRTLCWSEPPVSPEGKKRDVWHYRLFYADPDYILPLLPRGEVYSREFTEAGWLSYSDVRAKEEAEEKEAVERAMNP